MFKVSILPLLVYIFFKCISSSLGLTEGELYTVAWQPYIQMKSTPVVLPLLPSTVHIRAYERFDFPKPNFSNNLMLSPHHPPQLQHDSANIWIWETSPSADCEVCQAQFALASPWPSSSAITSSPSPAGRAETHICHRQEARPLIEDTCKSCRRQKGEGKRGF